MFHVYIGADLVSVWFCFCVFVLVENGNRKGKMLLIMQKNYGVYSNLTLLSNALGILGSLLTTDRN